MSYKIWYGNFLINRFNVIIQRLVEHGIINYLKEENKRIMRILDHHSGRVIANTVDSVSLNDAQDTFLILFVGLLIAFFSFSIEYSVVAVLKYRARAARRIQFLN